MKYLVIIFLFFSCIKSVDNPASMDDERIKKTNTTLESKYLIKDLGITILTITLDPMVTCYTYRNGQIPRPCDIFVDISCTLSKPITSAIRVELSKLNIMEMERAPNAREVESVVLIIAPNTTKITMKSTLTNLNNQHIPDIFRLDNVTIYQPKH